MNSINGLLLLEKSFPNDSRFFTLACRKFSVRITTTNSQFFACWLDIIPLTRVFELAELVSEQLFYTDFPLKHGLILTGGGADIAGITKAFASTCEATVHKKRPSLPEVSAHTCTKSPLVITDENISGKFATVKGLLYLYANEITNKSSRDNGSKIYGYLQQFTRWLKELAS